MKVLIAAASAAVLAAAAIPAAAQAQDMTGTTFYGTLGYAHTNTDDFNTGAIQGRLGARFNPYVGVEGEGSIGVKGDDLNVGGVNVDVKQKHSAAIYGVGFMPIGPNTDILARVGYGTTKVKAEGGGVSVTDDGESWNFGIGAQHHFDGVNGVRMDYTRQEFRGDGGSANVWSIGYSRRF